MHEDSKSQGREYARRLAKLLATSSAPFEVTGPDGSTLQVHREPDGTLVTESPATGSTQTRVWRPTDERPPDYPAGLPFLAGTTGCTSVTDGPGRMSMAQWWNVFDGGQAFERLITESLADGWEERPVTGADASGQRRQFVRGHSRRVISRTRAQERDFLMWMQAERQGEGG